MAWIELVIAGGLEVFWSTFMKLSEGFTKWWPTVWTVLGMLASFFFLSRAVHTLPMGTAYAVWTGIGAVGAFAAGVVMFFREPVTAPRLLFMALLLIGIIGLKITSAE